MPILTRCTSVCLNAVVAKWLTCGPARDGMVERVRAAAEAGLESLFPGDQVGRRSVARRHVGGEAADVGFEQVGCLLGLAGFDCRKDGMVVGSKAVTDLGPAFVTDL